MDPHHRGDYLFERPVCSSNIAAILQLDSVSNPTNSEQTSGWLEGAYNVRLQRVGGVTVPVPADVSHRLQWLGKP